MPPSTGFAGVGNSVVLTTPLCTAVRAHSKDGAHFAHAGTRDPSAPLPGEQRRARKTGSKMKVKVKGAGGEGLKRTARNRGVKGGAGEGGGGGGGEGAIREKTAARDVIHVNLVVTRLLA